jgi:hypothetical protein
VLEPAVIQPRVKAARSSGRGHPCSCRLGPYSRIACGSGRRWPCRGQHRRCGLWLPSYRSGIRSRLCHPCVYLPARAGW